MILPAGCSGQRPNEEIVESRTGMRTTALPASDYIITLGNEVGSAVKVEVRKSFSEARHESLNVILTVPRTMQWIFQEHVRRSEFVNDIEIACFTPEICEPPAYDGFVELFLWRCPAADSLPTSGNNCKTSQRKQSGFESIPAIHH
jgi:hypothetical protein